MIPNVERPGYFYATMQEIEEIKKYIIPVSKEEYGFYGVQTVPAWYEREDNFEFMIQRDMEKIMPMTAEVISTLRCPYRCEQCSYRPQKESLGVWDNQCKDKLDMSLGTMEIVIQRLVEAGVKNVVFTGGGEPLSNAEVTLQGMKIAKRNDMNVCLYTNGLLMNKERIEKIIENEPQVCRISIYGFDEKGYANYTKMEKDGFFRVVENVKWLIREKQERNLKINIALSFLIHPIMFEHIQAVREIDIWKMLENLFGMQYLQQLLSIRFTPAVDYYHKEQIEKSFFDDLFMAVEEADFKAKEFGVVIKPYYHRLNDLYNRKPYEKCKACGLYAEIGIDGTMYQCCEKLFIKEYAIGNIINNSIEEIYDSDLRKKVLNSLNVQQCPPVCKPHEVNKKMREIECQSINNPQQYFMWYEMLKKMPRSQDVLGVNNAFES